MNFGMEKDSYTGIDIVIKSSDRNPDSIYLFILSIEGFNHMFGIIDEYPSIEYTDDNEEGKDGKLRIVGVDMI